MTNETLTQTTTTGKTITLQGGWYTVGCCSYRTLTEAQAHDERIAGLTVTTPATGKSHWQSATGGNWTGD